MAEGHITNGFSSAKGPWNWGLAPWGLGWGGLAGWKKIIQLDF